MDRRCHGQRDRVVDAYVDLFNHPPGSRENLDRLVSEDARFVDPFNELAGIDQVHHMLVDFAARVDSPRFDIIYRAWDGDVCLLRWWMQGRAALIGEWSIPGVSELHFDRSGKICVHIDHWDAATYFYQRLPLVGTLLRWVKRRVAAGSGGPATRPT